MLGNGSLHFSHCSEKKKMPKGMNGWLSEVGSLHFFCFFLSFFATVGLELPLRFMTFSERRWSQKKDSLNPERTIGLTAEEALACHGKPPGHGFLPKGQPDAESSDPFTRLPTAAAAAPGSRASWTNKGWRRSEWTLAPTPAWLSEARAFL